MGVYFGSLLAALLLGAATPSLADSGAIAEPATAAEETAIGDALAVLRPPPGWGVAREGKVWFFTAPEGDARIAMLVMKDAADARTAVAAGWAQVHPGFDRLVRLEREEPTINGWAAITSISYDVPPSEKRTVEAIGYASPNGFLVVLIDGAAGTVTKRRAQINAALATLRTEGYTEESFAGRRAHLLDATRIEEIVGFAEQARKDLAIPGVGLALIDQGRIVWEGGLGMTDGHSGAKVGKDTRFMVGSNTKGMTTLLLASLVDEGKLDWSRLATDYMPRFRLGGAEITAKVEVRHLVCACTGLPRKDLEFILNTPSGTRAENLIDGLTELQPTSGFGEVYQYNNQLPAAAGYLAAGLVHPELELGEGYANAMTERIFIPLTMSRTTFDWSKATRDDWARPHGVNLSGAPVLLNENVNQLVTVYAPSGGAWSSAHDMALYVLNELNEGVLPSGRRMISTEALMARRTRNIVAGDKRWYGMGIQEDASSGVSVFGHGGSVFGYKSAWFAVPDAEAGIVVLTNSDIGYSLTEAMKRKLLEVLYDGKATAAGMVANSIAKDKQFRRVLMEEAPLPVPADLRPRVTGKYAHPALGVMTIAEDEGKLMFRSTSLQNEVAVRQHPDGGLSLVFVGPLGTGLEAQILVQDGRRQLLFNDGQHEYRADEF